MDIVAAHDVTVEDNSPPVGGVTLHPAVIPDPHDVYYDAVSHSPWDHDGNGSLPQRGDWSTYRYTVKDLILGIVTHRYNKNNRRLEIRAYFAGEHPIFQELEATKALFIVLCCQAYQSGQSMELFFENRVPFDIRELLERAAGIVVSGHERVLDATITRQAFGALSSFSEQEQQAMDAQGIPVETVCYNTYRGTWTADHVKGLIARGIPLRWLFKQRLNPVRRALSYAHLMGHLRAVLLEEYALRRLEDRPMGESLGRKLERADADHPSVYRSATAIRIDDAAGPLDLAANMPFCLLSVQPGPPSQILRQLQYDIAAARRQHPQAALVALLTMDVMYLPAIDQQEIYDSARGWGAQPLLVGVTWAQLLSEAEYLMSVTAAEADDSEVESVNVDRFPD